MDCYSIICIADFRDDGVQVKTRIVLLQKCRSFPLDQVVITTLVPNIVVCIAELIEGEVFTRSSENERTLLGRVGILPVCPALEFVRLFDAMTTTYPIPTIPQPGPSYHQLLVAIQPVQGQYEQSDLAGFP